MSERSRTRLEPDVRREQILDTAAVLFDEKDYSAVTLEELADRAGVTRGLLHHYFGSKRGLYLAVIERAVRIPDGVRLVPAGAGDEMDEVITESVRLWMRLMEATGGTWAGIGDTAGMGGSDVDEILGRARDDLVERMVEELPFPDHLDRDMLRIALRAYGALAGVTTAQWLADGELDTAQAEALLRHSLLALVDIVVPAMGDARKSD